MYYFIVRKFVFSNMPKGGFDCFLIDKQVIEVLRNLEEKNSSIMLQILWVGFRPKVIKFIRKSRKSGKSRWTINKKIKLVMDSMISFSQYPIKLVSYIGVLSCIVSCLGILYVIFSKLCFGEEIIGWTSTMAVILMAFGIIMFTLGILGQYMWRILEDTRNRPAYIIEESDE